MTQLLLAVLPELLLVTFGCIVMIVGLSKDKPTAQLATPLGIVGVLLATLLVVASADWFARPEVLPSGIYIGQLAIYVKLIALIVATIALLAGSDAAERLGHGDYVGMVLFSTAGVMLTGSATDLVTLFFALELTSVPTYVLVTLSRGRDDSHEAGTKYFFLGALSSALTLYGFALMYGATGSTLLTDMIPAAQAILAGGMDGYYTLLLGTLLAFGGLSYKLAAVPFHLYTADVYSGAHPTVTGFIGFQPKMAGFVALVAVLAPLSWPLPWGVATAIGWVAIFSMFFGNTLALLQTNVQRMMAYSSIAHTGYLLVAVLAGPGGTVAGHGLSADGIAALLFYLGGYGVMNFGVLAVLASVRRGQEPAATLDDLAGLSRTSPLAALTLLICSLSLLGFPPLIGFWGKVAVFGAAWNSSAVLPLAQALVIIGVVNSAISAGYYLRLAGVAYLRDAVHTPQHSSSALHRAALVGCTIFVVLMGIRFDTLYGRARAGSRMPVELEQVAHRPPQQPIHADQSAHVAR